MSLFKDENLESSTGSGVLYNALSGTSNGDTIIAITWVSGPEYYPRATSSGLWGNTVWGSGNGIIRPNTANFFPWTLQGISAVTLNSHPGYATFAVWECQSGGGTFLSEWTIVDTTNFHEWGVHLLRYEDLAGQSYGFWRNGAHTWYGYPSSDREGLPNSPVRGERTITVASIPSYDLTATRVEAFRNNRWVIRGVGADGYRAPNYAIWDSVNVTDQAVEPIAKYALSGEYLVFSMGYGEPSDVTIPDEAFPVGG